MVEMEMEMWRWRWKCGDGNVEMEMEKHYKRKQQRQSLSQQQAGSKTTYEDQVTSMYIFPLFKDLFWYNVNNLNKLVLTGGRYWVGKLDRSCISKLVRICTMPNIGAILPSLLEDCPASTNLQPIYRFLQTLLAGKMVHNVWSKECNPQWQSWTV